MSEEKKIAVTEEVKEESRQLSEEELEKVNGGAEPRTIDAPGGAGRRVIVE